MSTSLAVRLKSKKNGTVSVVVDALASWYSGTPLDAILAEGGVPPLSDFIHRDIEVLREALEYAPDESSARLQENLNHALHQPEWHEPSEGLRTVHQLMQLSDRSPAGQMARQDLIMIEKTLLDAEATGDLFRLEGG